LGNPEFFGAGKGKAMNKVLRLVGILCFLVFLIISSTAVLAIGEGNSPSQETGRIMVKFKSGIHTPAGLQLLESYQTALASVMERLEVLVVEVPLPKLTALVGALSASPLVEYVETDTVATALLTPDDPDWTEQWGLSKVDAVRAWDTTTGAGEIRIAILDSGVDLSHPDISSKIVANRNFTSSGTVDDLYGHGTHCAGIAAAITDNGVGVAGLGYNCNIMNVKVLGDSGSGYYSWIANGIIWAADNGANVISMSIGGTTPSTTLKNAVDYAWSKGVVVVAAAGNNATNAAFYPAFYANCIAVAATDPSDIKASFSNYGSWVDVAAPGVDIFSTLNQGQYGYKSGTSMSAPLVAGLAGLLWSTEFGTSNTSVRERIEGTAEAIEGTGVFWTYGRVDASEAVGLTFFQTRLDVSAPNTVFPGQEVSLVASLSGGTVENPADTHGQTVAFNYVLFGLEGDTSEAGTISASTDDLGNATFVMTAPLEKSVIMVDAVFMGSDNLLASSNMKIISVIPIIASGLRATSQRGLVAFELTDQFGNAIVGQALSFLTTDGTLSEVSAITDDEGIARTTISGTTLAVVSASFGGYNAPSGWAYQPTMVRITVVL
jgi:thermitase